MELELTSILRGCINEKLLRIIISNSREKKLQDGISKIKIRPVVISDNLAFQVTEYVGTKVIHTNYNNQETVAYVERMVLNSFKQCEILNKDINVNILVSKKGKVTISKKRPSIMTIDSNSVNMGITNHNREKNYILKEGIPVPFLVDLGVMNKDGDIIKPKYDKFRQINRFLEFIKDIVKDLPKDREISIIDFGCGKSYLTFAIYYYLHDLCNIDVRITGLDLKKDVITKCNSLSEKYGFDKLCFKLGDIADYNEQDKTDMVVTLHACDIATDYALYKAISWNASVILSVPCCQHELNRQIHNSTLSPILDYGILKDRFAAIVTDTIRAEVLKTKGYKTDILEFIDMEHTPKNLLIRAVKGNETGNYEKLKKMVEELKAEPTLMRLLDM